MEKSVSLKSIEKQAFRMTFTDGLWEVLGGCFVLLFSLAPVLSEFMGDFWSSMVFLPFWAVVYWCILLLRRRIVAPRLGCVKYGSRRLKKVRAFNLIMAGINLVLVTLGILAFLSLNGGRGGEIAGLSRLYTLFPGVLIGLGLAFSAWLLDYPRLYFYTALFIAAPPLGEYLAVNYGANHHGFPIVYGGIAALMVIFGGLSFFRMMNMYPSVEK